MGWRAAQKIIHYWKILRGDNVMVTRGKDLGGTGVVKHVIRSQNHLIVEGGKSIGHKDTPMDLALEKTYDAKTGKGMLDLINLLFNFIADGCLSVKEVALQLRLLLWEKQLLVSVAEGVKLTDLQVWHNNCLWLIAHNIP